MDLTSNPASSTSHTQPPTNRTLVQGTNYNQPKAKLSQGTNLTKPAYLHYPLHHPPVGNLLLLQGELWIETENIYRKKNKFVNIFPNSFQHRGESVDLSPRQWQGIEELLLDTCKRFFYSNILRSCFQARSYFILQSIGMKQNFFELRRGNCKMFLFLLNFLSCFAFQLLCNYFSG